MLIHSFSAGECTLCLFSWNYSKELPTPAMSTGASNPPRQLCISPWFQNPLFIFSHRLQIFNFPPFFAISIHFPLLFRENYYFPLLFKISPCFRQIYVFLTYFMCSSFPPSLTIVHVCITQCTYWTPLAVNLN